MSVLEYRIPIIPNGDGEASGTVRAAGAKLLGVQVEMGTISSMDVAITDEPSGRSLLALSGQSADAQFQPAQQLADPADGTDLTGAFGVPTVFGRLEVAVTNGDEAAQGEITIVVER